MVIRPQGRNLGVNQLALIWTALIAAPSILDLSRDDCAAGIAALTMVPLLLIWLRQRRLLIGDPIVVLGFVWMLAVTFPTFLPDLYKDRMWHELSPWSFDEAARWMYRSWGATTVAYWFGRNWFGMRQGRPPSAFDHKLQMELRRWIGIVGLLGTLLFLVVRGGQTSQLTEDLAVADSTVQQILILLMQMSFAYIFLYFFEKDRSNVTRFETRLLYAVIAAQMVVAIGSASKYAMMVMGAAWILGQVTSQAHKGILKGVRLAVAAIAGVMLISYFVAAYRGELVSRPLTLDNTSVIDTVGLQLDAAGSALTTIVKGEEIKGYYAEGYDSFFILDRFAHLSAFAVFMDFIGFESAYENAWVSLVAPVFAVIPAAIVEGKIHFFDSGDFARMYGWTHGGLSITTPGSFFWAWGYPGMILGMAGLGLMIAWLWSRSFGFNSDALVARIVMVTVVLSLLDVGVTFQHVAIPATRVLLLVLLLRWGLRVWLRTSRAQG